MVNHLQPVERSEIQTDTDPDVNETNSIMPVKCLDPDTKFPSDNQRNRMECADSNVNMDSISRNRVSAVGTEKVSK